jgi:hypothetical protein
MGQWTQSKDFKKNSFFSEEIYISTDLNYTLNFKKQYNAYTGDGRSNSLSDNRFNIIEVSPVLLTFKDIDPTVNLKQIMVLLEFDGNKTLNRTIKPLRNSLGQFEMPESLKYIVPNLKTVNSLRLTVNFVFADGVKKWKYSGQNLLEFEDFKDGTVFFKPEDIMK